MIGESSRTPPRVLRDIMLNAASKSAIAAKGGVPHGTFWPADAREPADATEQARLCTRALAAVHEEAGRTHGAAALLAALINTYAAVALGRGLAGPAQAPLAEALDRLRAAAPEPPLPWPPLKEKRHAR